MPDEDHFTVNFAAGRSIDLDEIRKRASPFMPDGGHAWVINTVFALDDPEQALDEMELSDKNFIGITNIHCMLCSTKYVGTNRFHKCSQSRPVPRG